MTGGFLSNLSRKKFIDDTEQSDLTRCLSTFNLVGIGVGSTLGAGVYVLTGSVAKDDAGPSIVLSFFVAAFASMLAGLCYAEFGARVPKAGSAYIYSYVTVGEFCGFVIGWNLILEYIIGTSSVARAWSANLDSLTGGVIAAKMREVMPMSGGFFAQYPDFLAVGLILIITILLAIGMQVSSVFLSVLTVINILVLIFCSIAGFIKADTHNWNLSPEEVNGHGTGGFMPYGFSKMMQGAATCFFAFVGFDTIACVGEEAKNPSKSIPRSIVITLIICLVAYVSVSAAVTLMQPYYLLDINAPLPTAFNYTGLTWATKPIAVGSMCALIASALGAAVGMPRIVFSMARDGLIFKALAQVSARTKAPVAATILSGVLSSAMAVIFDLDDLVNMMSIGTLMAYTLVAFSVLTLRYRPSSQDYFSFTDKSPDEDSPLLPNDKSAPTSYYCPSLRELFYPKLPVATSQTSRIVLWCTLIDVVLMVLLSSFLVWGEDNIPEWYGIVLIVIIFMLCTFFSIAIARQPESKTQLLFKTPLVPAIPLLSLFINIYLMLKLPTETWIRFAIWMVLGFLMYFGYGMQHSEERLSAQRENEENNENSSSSNRFVAYFSQICD